MNATDLLAMYERVSDAPDAVTKMRQLVLELAVRGQLVERSAPRAPDVESPDSTPRNVGIPEEERFVDIPRSWSWKRVSEIGSLAGGMTPAMGRAEYWDGDVVWLSPKDIKADEVSNSELKITAKGLYETRLKLFPPGSLFIVARSGILKRMLPVAINTVAATANQDLKVLVPFQGSLSRYLQIMLRGFERFILNRLVKTGTTVQSLRYDEFEHQAFPLPPLAEQHRIVAKVDELMALCDQLDAARTEREVARDRMAAASFARLNSPDPDTFQSDARFALNVLPALSARPDQIKPLRQTILNLAVRGKLLRQDPLDEPAEHIVEYIASRRLKLSSQGLLPKPKARTSLSSKDEPFLLPRGWKWALLGDLCYRVADGPHYSPPYVAEQNGVPFLSTRNIRVGGFELSSLKYVSREDHAAFCKKVKPEKGDILYTKGGTTGIAKVNDLDFEFSVWVHVAVLRIEKEALSPRYVELALNSPHCYQQSQELTQGTSNSDLGLTRMINITVPLPPLAEQLRIVAKVDELMIRCDQLEASLSGSDTARSRLLDVFLREALDSDRCIAAATASKSVASMARPLQKPNALSA